MAKAIKRILAAVCIIVAAALLFILTVNAFVCIKASRRFSDADSACGGEPDYILVLGCGLNADGTPAKMLSDRLDKAVEIYKKHGGKLLLSGDGVSSPYYNEPSAMRRAAVERGVPPEDIVTDVEGVSTSESIRRAKEVFGAGKLVIVTQKYHLYRAVYVALALGIDAEGVSADKEGSASGFQRLVREVLARVKDVFNVNVYKNK